MTHHVDDDLHFWKQTIKKKHSSKFGFLKFRLKSKIIFRCWQRRLIKQTHIINQWLLSVCVWIESLVTSEWTDKQASLECLINWKLTEWSVLFLIYHWDSRTNLIDLMLSDRKTALHIKTKYQPNLFTNKETKKKFKKVK